MGDYIVVAVAKVSDGGPVWTPILPCAYTSQLICLHLTGQWIFASGTGRQMTVWGPDIFEVGYAVVYQIAN